MDYANELKKLKEKMDEVIKKAEKEGYILKPNGELVKNESVYVAEVYFRGETTYESSGSYWFERHTLELTEEEWEKFSNIEISSSEDVLDNIIFSNIIGDKLEGTYWGDTLEWGGLTYKNADEINLSFCSKDNYEDLLGENEDFLLEVYFDNKKDDEGNIDGYISIYKLPIETYSKIKEKDFSIYFDKYFKFN